MYDEEMRLTSVDNALSWHALSVVAQMTFYSQGMPVPFSL